MNTSPQTLGKKRSQRRWWRIFTAAIIVLVVIPCVAAYLYLCDSSSPNTSDLHVSARPIPAAENAAVPLYALRGKIQPPLPKSMIRDFYPSALAFQEVLRRENPQNLRESVRSTLPSARVHPYMTANQEALDLFADAMSRPAIVLQEPTPDFSDHTSSVDELYEAVELESKKMFAQFADSKDPDVLQTAAATLLFAKKYASADWGGSAELSAALQAQQALLCHMETLCGGFDDPALCRTAATAITASRIDAEDYATALKWNYARYDVLSHHYLFGGFENMPDIAATMGLTSYIEKKDSLSTKILSAHVYKPNAMKCDIAKNVREFIAEARNHEPGITLPTPEERMKQQDDAIAKSPLRFLPLRFSTLHFHLRNSINDILIQQFQYNAANTYARLVRTDAHSRMAECAFALRAYWLEHNRTLPRSLEELVPAYLPKSPASPFLKKPLAYDSEARTLSMPVTPGQPAQSGYERNSPENEIPIWKLNWSSN